MVVVRHGVGRSPGRSESSSPELNSHVYAYKVPWWVVKEAGGIHRFDGAREILIPEHLWPHVKFVGKSMDKAKLTELVETFAFKTEEFRRSRPREQSQMRRLPPGERQQEQRRLDQRPSHGWDEAIRTRYDSYRTAGSMGLQVHTIRRGERFDPKRLKRRSPRNKPGWPKPYGDLFWTSTLTGRHTDWLRVCEYDPDMGRAGKQAAIFSVKPSAKVLHIRSEAFLKALEDEVPLPNRDHSDPIPGSYIDWELLAKVYDGVHADYVISGWDAESTVWFNPGALKFERMVDVQHSCSYDPDLERDLHRYELRVAAACGDCYRWAYQDVRRNGGVLVHGTVRIPLSKRAHTHAWVERGGKVYDWQTMEAGLSRWARKGWPKDEFYAAMSPTRMTRYEADDALMAFARSRGGRESGGIHYGPW